MEFKSKLEDLIPTTELLFDSTPGFGDYKPFLEQAVAHPAKINMKLLEFLLKKYTEEGDVVLDPMSGSGSTGVVAALLNRNAVCVELEEKFHKWQLEAKTKLENSNTLSPKGKMVCLLGDARKLHGLLQTANKIVTSPPYSEGIGHKAGDNASGEHKARLGMQRKYTEQMTSEGNIAKLKHGEIAAVISSPPYEESLGSKHHSPRADKIAEEKALSTTYTERQVDVVVTSPPFAEDAAPHTSIRPEQKQEPKRGYTDSKSEKNNIGNLKKETYLQAMLQCYREMYAILKHGGQAIIVVKPFIRNKKVVDLPFQTWLLMKKCGFKLVNLYKLKLTQQSFWRILYMKKHPAVPELWHEYVLVCQK